MLHIKLKGIRNAQNMIANILPAGRPHPLTLGFGSKGQKSTFSEHGHVAYKIKGNHKFSNKVANILPADPSPMPPPRPRGWGH